MEDLSRELEREIARAKPSPHRAKKHSQILIIDNFGALRSGGYLKVLVYFFSVIGLIGIMGTTGFYFLFDSVQKANTELKDRLAVAEKKIHSLTNDKELLMARLVMAGKKPDLPPPAKEKQPGILPKSLIVQQPDKLKADKPGETPIPTDTGASLVPEKTDSSAPEAASNRVDKQPEPQVAVERFSVVQGKTAGQLSVRFNIRNISTRSREISGRLLAVLKPESGGQEKWVVVPGGRLENNIPGPYRKGQYFSISRFKPVRFTINNQAPPGSFKLASVYIFDEDGKLFFENTVQINKAE